jgi:glycosyltransferase involved in cell wall biosynthesis
MDLSVVIPCLNAAGKLGEQLEALARQEWDGWWEVIVADNGSSDGSRAVAQRYAERLPHVRCIDASQRRGAPFARNAGAAAAQGEGLAFCDADDVVAPGWVEALACALDRHVIVAGRMDFDALNVGWTATSRPRVQTEGLQYGPRPGFLPHAGGGNLAIRRELFNRLGGFDESLPVLEDTDLCWKAQLAGAQLHFCSDALVHVRLQDSMANTFRQARRYAHYNVILYKRYRPHGMARRSPLVGLAAWLLLPVRLLRVRDRGSLALWVWALGWRVGRLRGSLRERVLAL